MDVVTDADVHVDAGIQGMLVFGMTTRVETTWEFAREMCVELDVGLAEPKRIRFVNPLRETTASVVVRCSDHTNTYTHTVTL